jgi:hypothetical protein
MASHLGDGSGGLVSGIRQPHPWSSRRLPRCIAMPMDWYPQTLVPTQMIDAK